MGKIFEALEKSKHISSDGIQDQNIPFSSDAQRQKDSIEESAERVDHKTTFSKEEDDFDLPQNLNASLVTLTNPNSIEAEQFRLLKNNILFPEKGTPPRSIMITSASPGEGKSFVASNLAVSIAQNIDEHVLLMDCDLRSPKIHSIFNLPQGPGLSEYLSQAKPLSSLLVKTFINKLTILPAGTIPKNPSELLSSEQMRRLIHEVRLRYSDRYIIIDTPPPYITSEANAIVRQVDGVLMVIRHGKTRKKDVEDIINIYGREKIIGVVQNFAEKRAGYGYGYYKYGYGYGK
ncbi:MAG: polysaccharide biosynthesis tyrosine autokinase [Desulfobacula sp.]|nr:polysaccharide biosynthesis tyrosine autokinase [Desulfobacula sp.]MDA8134491.1 polysaccharide biosynthesis tyrosine autokinase [Desulfobacteraceae bacterium]